MCMYLLHVMYIFSPEISNQHDSSMETDDSQMENYAREVFNLRKIQGHVFLIVLPMIVSVGLTSNFLSIMVFTANRKQIVRSHIYMLFLCIFDMLSLCCKSWSLIEPILQRFLTSWKTSFLNPGFGLGSCLMTNLAYLFQSIFSSLLILISVDRLWCVYSPLTHYLSSKRFKPFLYVAITILINSCVILPVYPLLQAGQYMNETNEYVCYTKSRNNAPRLWLLLIRRVVGNGLIQFLVLGLLNLCLIVKLVSVFRKRVQRRNDSLKGDESKLSAKNFKKTILTVTMIGFCLLCNLPCILFSFSIFQILLKNNHSGFKSMGERQIYLLLYRVKYIDPATVISLIPSLIYSYFSSKDAKFFVPQLRTWFVPKCLLLKSSTDP